MNDLDSIRRVLALYSQLLDDKRFDEWGELFTDDAVFVAHGQRRDGRLRIVDEIGALIEPLEIKHLMGPSVIDVESPDRARAWTDLTSFVRAESGVAVATIGRYYDELERGQDDLWRLSRRELVAVGQPLSKQLVPPPHR